MRHVKALRPSPMPIPFPVVSSVRRLSIERATLSTDEDVQQWTDRQQKTLLAAIKDGPVLVN